MDKFSKALQHGKQRSLGKAYYRRLCEEVDEKGSDRPIPSESSLPSKIRETARSLFKKDAINQAKTTKAAATKTFLDGYMALKGVYKFTDMLQRYSEEDMSDKTIGNLQEKLQKRLKKINNRIKKLQKFIPNEDLTIGEIVEFYQKKLESIKDAKNEMKKVRNKPIAEESNKPVGNQQESDVEASTLSDHSYHPNTEEPPEDILLKRAEEELQKLSNWVKSNDQKSGQQTSETKLKDLLLDGVRNGINKKIAEEQEEINKIYDNINAYINNNGENIIKIEKFIYWETINTSLQNILKSTLLKGKIKEEANTVPDMNATLEKYKNVADLRETLSRKYKQCKEYLDTRLSLGAKVKEVEKALNEANTDDYSQEEGKKIQESITTAKQSLNNKEATIEMLSEGLQKLTQDYKNFKELKYREYLEKIELVPIEQFLKKGDISGTPHHMFWAVDSDQNLFIVPKDVTDPSGKQLEITDAITHQHPSVQALGEAIVVIASLPGYKSGIEACLIDINSRSSSNMADDSHLKIGKDAFRKKIPLLEDILQSLKDQETYAEQTPLPLSGSSELGSASDQAKDLWKKLSGEHSDSQLGDDTLSDYSDNSGNYTKGEQARVRMIANLAAELSFTTKDIKNQFQMEVVPSRDNTVKYEDDWNRLHVPANAPLLKTVLSIISEMDRAKYEWATPQDLSTEEKAKENYAQTAATAIRQIEACRKLSQSIPNGLSADLPSLATAYNDAYINASATTQSEDVARQRIYDIYAEKISLNKLCLSRVDARNYEVYNPQSPKGVEGVSSIREIRWKIFRNRVAPDVLHKELKIAENQEMKPASLGDSHFDEVIKKGTLIWIISMGEKTLVCPRIGKNYFSTHAALARGRPVLAAGEVNIYKNGENDYELLSINHRSGHFRSLWKLPYTIGRLHLQGIRFRSLSSPS